MQSDFSDIDLDLRGVYCPMAFVKLRIHADGLVDNKTFTVAFDDTNANEPLIRSTQSLGHLVTVEKSIKDLGNSLAEQMVIVISVQVKR